MKISELKNCPKWLKAARTTNANVEMQHDRIIWYGGEWRGGVWHGGDWYGGEWYGGVWHGGVWQGDEHRIRYMASCMGIVFQQGKAIGYRTTHQNGRGRYDRTFRQPEGEWYDPNAVPSGGGTCRPGIHITTAARAWTYFGIDPTCQFWRVEFKEEDLLDCDGDKARIRGGIFTKIPRPF